MLLVAGANASTEHTGFFAPLWTAIDWTFGVVGSIKNTITGFIIKATVYISLWFMKIKLAGIVFAWEVVKPILDALDIGSTLNTYVSQVSPDAGAFLHQNRVGEAINIILSAFLTRKSLDMIGW